MLSSYATRSASGAASSSSSSSSARGRRSKGVGARSQAEGLRQTDGGGGGAGRVVERTARRLGTAAVRLDLRRGVASALFAPPRHQVVERAHQVVDRHAEARCTNDGASEGRVGGRCVYAPLLAV